VRGTRKVVKKMVMREEIWDCMERDSRVGDGKTCWKRERRKECEGCDRKEGDRDGNGLERNGGREWSGY
jgi:hypothetical protein